MKSAETQVKLEGKSYDVVNQLQISYFHKQGVHLSKPNAIKALLEVSGIAGVEKALTKLIREDES